MKHFLTLLLLNFLLISTAGAAPQKPPAKEIFFVESHATGAEGGIYRYALDTTDGTIAPLGVTRGLDRLSFMAIHKEKPCLYAVLRDGDMPHKIMAFAIDPETFDLTRLNEQPSKGANPCSVTVSADGRYAMIANYTGGSVAVFPIAEDGSLATASDVLKYTGGSGVDPGRQKEAHPHMVNVSPRGGFVYVPDLGQDRVHIYRLVDGKLEPATLPEASTRPGAGPRHCDFHPIGPWAYVINELDSTVGCYRHDPKTGELEAFQTISTLPASFAGKSFCADIHIDPSGRFLYGSNRGHNSIAIFAIAPQTGRLTAVGHQSTGGDWPRNFAIDPSGRFLLVANRRTNDIHTFRIKKDGTLTPVGTPIKVPQPVCIKFLVP